ncbi:hypothetical protein Pcinc_029453 [Petrolisthes cinctipes]|uniref:Uncharacterized protein n=1 Tax=Petrolisthes cinctipes TaxID=88211 RepID=A0AAE1K7H3_PETCI|nr:hypothetical protein Pcinc_029453 [Petrolisthes cinctipes]
MGRVVRVDGSCGQGGWVVWSGRMGRVLMVDEVVWSGWMGRVFRVDGSCGDVREGAESPITSHPKKPPIGPPVN